MRVTKLTSSRLVLVKTKDYIINWDKAPSKGQKVLQEFLYPYWKGDLVLAEMRIPGSLLRADLINCNKKIHLEFSGRQHIEFVKHFAGNRVGYLKQIKNDCKKEEWARRNGFKFAEIFEEDLKKLSYDWFVSEFGIYL